LQDQICSIVRNGKFHFLLHIAVGDNGSICSGQRSGISVLNTISDQRFSFVSLDEITILAVDDDPIHREFATVYLGAPGTSVVTADSAEAGLAQLENCHFDIALIDVDMPGMSGIDMVRTLRTDPRYDNLPIIVITGREDMASIDRAYDAGATSFMCKPVNWRLLSHQVKFLLRAHKAIRKAEARNV
jgi:DNA-binding response OmpR family regulator